MTTSKPQLFPNHHPIDDTVAISRLRFHKSRSVFVNLGDLQYIRSNTIQINYNYNPFFASMQHGF